MEKIALFLMIQWWVTALAYAECTYAFDAHPTQLAIYSLLQEGNTTRIKSLPISVMQQMTVTLPDMPQQYMRSSHAGMEKLIAALNQSGKLVSKSSSKAPGKFNKLGNDHRMTNNGIWALEYQIDQFTPQLLTADNYYKMGLRLYGSSAGSSRQNDLMIELNITNSAIAHNRGSFININAVNLVTGQSEVKSYPLSLPINADYRIGLYVNAKEGKLGLILNSDDQGYISHQLPRQIKHLVLAPFVVTDLDPTNPVVGSTLAATLLTDRKRMRLSYPPLTADICGQAVN